MGKTYCVKPVYTADKKRGATAEMKSKPIDKKISQRLLKNRGNLPFYSALVLIVICLVGLTSAVHATNDSWMKIR